MHPGTDTCIVLSSLFPRVRVPVGLSRQRYTVMESGSRSGLYPPGFGRGSPRQDLRTPEGGLSTTRMAAVRNVSGDWGQHVQGQLRAQAHNNADNDPNNEWLLSRIWDKTASATERSYPQRKGLRECENRRESQ